jgi:uncharacterized membrane protein
MSTIETEQLPRDLSQYRAEREKIRALLGQIGGKASATRDRIVNAVFVVALVVLLFVDVFRHLHAIELPLPPLFTLELGILLVSVKIVWMIHRQARVEHFQFWILNSIEFRLNEISKRLRSIEDALDGRGT